MTHAEPHPRRSAVRHGWRHAPAFDGVRGLAVVAVVAFHLDEAWLPGGYLGVDVFFVLSGYLITRLLLMEATGPGRVDLGRFWARRGRRLLPGMVLLIGALALTLPALDPVERWRRVPELIAGLGYASNWQLIDAGAGYFAEFTGASPVRHLWSLAIEAQFYLLWPLLVWAVGSRRLTGVAALAGAGASIAAMQLLYDPNSSTRVYFGTDARVHQLLIGCLAAVALDARPARARGRWPGVGLVALAGIGVMMWTLPGTSPLYYRGGSVLVAVLAVALIVAIDAGDRSTDRLLSARPLRHVGERSYGIYLYHWPVIVLVDAELVGFGGLRLTGTQLAITAVLAELSYTFVERPIREGRPWGFELTPRRTLRLAGAGLAMAMVAVLVAGAGRSRPPAWAEADTGTAKIELQRADDGGAAASGQDEPDVRRVALVGDSVAWSLSSALAEVATERGLDFGEATVIGCPIILEPLYIEDGREYDPKVACIPELRKAQRAIREMAPDVLIVHDQNSERARRTDDGRLVIDGPEWEELFFEAWDEAIDAMRLPDMHVVVVVPPLRSLSAPGQCASDANPQRCEDVQAADARIRSVTRRYVARADDPLVHAIDVDDLVCAELPCAEFVDGTRLRGENPDLTHFVNPGAQWLAPALLDRALAATRGEPGSYAAPLAATSPGVRAKVM